MTPRSDLFRELLFPFIGAMAALLLLALIGLVIWRGVDEVRFLRRQRTIARYRPLVESLLTPAAEQEVLALLTAVPRRHRRVVADLILNALRLTTGDVVPRLREAARALGVVDEWLQSLDSRRWWVRTQAIRSLGLVREPSCIDALLAALDEPHEEVRAAAVDALGRIGDPRCAQALLARLRDESRHQRARLVQAIRAQGPAIVPVLLQYAADQPGDTALTIDILGVVGGTAAIDNVLQWSSSEDPVIRTAAMRAIGSIGLDDRSYYYALRALDDDDAEVRGMAARALGRSGRQTAVPYLAARLDDEWLVAAHCATGLRRLGRPGSAALETRAAGSGPGSDLARQMIWELTFLKVGA